MDLERMYTTPRDTENIKKEICRIFNHTGLRITIEANKQTINFLDVTFNLLRPVRRLCKSDVDVEFLQLGKEETSY